MKQNYKKINNIFCPMANKQRISRAFQCFSLAAALFFAGLGAPAAFAASQQMVSISLSTGGSGQSSASSYAGTNISSSVLASYVSNSSTATASQSVSTQASCPPPNGSVNLIANPSLEITTADGLPQSWQKSSWGSNDAVFAYPVAGYSKGKAVRVEINSYSDGDAKWYFNEVPAKTNWRYIFSDTYKSSVETRVVAQYRMADGSFQYQEIGLAAPSASWKTLTVKFSSVPNSRTFTVFHLLDKAGWLNVDNYSLRENGSASLSQGAVSLNFDDGWLSSYEQAYPLLQKSGLKATYYIFTDALNDPSQYMAIGQVAQLQAAGNEIGCHSKSHADLTQISPSQLSDEINGAKTYLASQGILTTTFAYPYGSYSATVQDAIKQAGFSAARSSNTGYNSKGSGAYNLSIQSVENTTTLEQIKGWINSAKNEKTWLILLFHKVLSDTAGEQYATTPQTLQGIADYLKAQNVPVITNAKGVQLIGY